MAVDVNELVPDCDQIEDLYQQPDVGDVPLEMNSLLQTFNRIIKLVHYNLKVSKSLQKMKVTFVF